MAARPPEIRKQTEAVLAEFGFSGPQRCGKARGCEHHRYCEEHL
jgi:hypothetical protein